MAPSAEGSVSYWMDSLYGGRPEARPPLSGDLDVDVAIVGGGYTGLWTAYYLLKASPGLVVAVLEAEVCGYGASGRNGGWCSSLFAASDRRLQQRFGSAAMHAMREAMNDTVDEVGRVAATEGIDCSFRKGGTITLARSRAQAVALGEELSSAREMGIEQSDLSWLKVAEARELLSSTGLHGALYSPHCAAIHPARLVRGLATAAEQMGASIFEESRVLEIVPAMGDGHRPALYTRDSRVSAGTIVVATEAYTATLSGRHRQLLPLYSLMVATEPLGDEAVASLGSALEGGTTFTDGRHLLIYGQLTADGRLAFGGRGAPYRFGSAIDSSYDRDRRVHDGLVHAIEELFPQLGHVAIAHRWGGPIGVPRDWFPSVCLNRKSGLARAGGYVGDGVATSNLAGRTLCDLILERDSPLVSLPWVGHDSPDWEREPLRYLGVNAGVRIMQIADAVEARTPNPSRLAKAVARITGD